jgi:hypothetical protein
MMPSMMDILAQPRTIAALVLCTTLLSVIHRKFANRSSTLPPGPPPDSWIFGNKLPNALCVPFPAD